MRGWGENFCCLGGWGWAARLLARKVLKSIFFPETCAALGGGEWQPVVSQKRSRHDIIPESFVALGCGGLQPVAPHKKMKNIVFLKLLVALQGWGWQPVASMGMKIPMAMDKNENTYDDQEIFSRHDHPPGFPLDLHQYCKIFPSQPL